MRRLPDCDPETMTQGLESRRDARDANAANTHAAIDHACGLLGSMARDLTAGHPERVLVLSTDLWSSGTTYRIQLLAPGMDALMDVEASEGAEDFTDLEATPIDGSVCVTVRYVPHWGAGKVSAIVCAIYDAAPAWLDRLLGKDGTPDEDLAPALAASLPGGAS